MHKLQRWKKTKLTIFINIIFDGSVQEVDIFFFEKVEIFTSCTELYKEKTMFPILWFDFICLWFYLKKKKL